MSIELIVSGGALGSDSVWSYIAEQHGVPKDKIIHIIATGLSRPVGNEARKAEQQSGTNKVLTVKELNTAIEHTWHMLPGLPPVWLYPVCRSDNHYYCI